MINTQQLPMQDLKIFGIYRDGRFTIPDAQVKALQEGRMTEVVELKDLKGKDIHIESLPARLSIVRGENGQPSLRVDPVYRHPKDHVQLTTDEKNRLLRHEVANIRKQYVDREGNVRTEIIAYDKNTNQFMSHDPRAVKAPHAVNEQPLSTDQKRKFKEGEKVNLDDGTIVQLDTTQSRGLRSNLSGLVCSVLVDGGISYLLFTGLSRILGKKSNEELAFSKGYAEGIKKVMQQVERRIALNPKDRDAVNDLNRIKQEWNNLAAAHPSEVKDKGYDDFKKLNSIDSEEGQKHGQRDRKI